MESTLVELYCALRFNGGLRALRTNNRLEWMSESGANALAYFTVVYFSSVKSWIALVPRLASNFVINYIFRRMQNFLKFQMKVAEKMKIGRNWRYFLRKTYEWN
jgi:hypothetical protein